jgi:flagellar biosynthesis/type III secretory pathway protein FliH
MTYATAGILFVEDFDTPPPRNAPGRDRPEIIAPVYTAEDVETAREEGRAAGMDDARAEHHAVQEALCTAALAAIGEALATARDDAGAVAERIGTALSGAILALLTTALPATAAKLAPAEIAALLAALLPPLSQTPGVAVRVHPDLLPYIAGQLSAFGDVTATGDANLAPSDVAIAWRDGHARRDWQALWTNITAALAPFGLPDHLPDSLADLLPQAEGSHNAG